MRILLIINDPPYGTERCFNALRLALALLKEEPRPKITVFLMADVVLAAKAGQSTPDGYYNLEKMNYDRSIDPARKKDPGVIFPFTWRKVIPPRSPANSPP